jgi:hypothetical protein
MSSPIFDGAPKVPSVFISPRFFLALFLFLNLSISEAEAQEISNKVANGESLNLNITQAELDKIVEQFKTDSENVGKIKINIDGNVLELKDLNIQTLKSTTGNFTFTIPGNKFKIPKECNVVVDFMIGSAANDNHLNDTSIRC